MSTPDPLVSSESVAPMEVVTSEAEPSAEPGREVPSASYSQPSTLGAGFGWNIAVIVLGGLIALAGFFAGFSADAEDSAIRQTVAALWVLQGLVGLLIATIGVLGATIIYAIETRRAAGSRAP